MKKIKLGATEVNQQKALIEKGYDTESLTKFKSKIKKVSVEEAKDLGKKLLDTVKANGNTYQVLSLIRDGASLEVYDDEYGDNALLKCAKRNYYENFNALVKAGVNINATSHEGKKKTVTGSTAVMWSARKGFLGILNDLILLGADLNLACSDGDTALISAVRHNQIEAVRLLVNANVILTAKNNKSESAVSIAQALGHKEILDIIGDHLIDGIEPDSELSPDTIVDELSLAKKKIADLKNN